MSRSLDEIIKPLGPRKVTHRPVAPASETSGMASSAVLGAIRQHGLPILIGSLSLAVALIWSIKAGYLVIPQHNPPVQTAMLVPQRQDLPLVEPQATPAQTAPKPTNFTEMAATIMPEIKAGYPPGLHKPAIITLPPDLSGVTVTSAPRAQSVPAPASKPAAKAKPQ